MILNYYNTPIYYEIQGKGPAVVLLHGFLESSLMWERFIPKIINTKTIFTIDFPGHGKSGIVGDVHTMELMADIVHDILERHKIKSATFIGHSMGGYVALTYTELYEDAVEKLFLLNSTPAEDSADRKINRERAMNLISRNPRSFISITIGNWFDMNSHDQFASEIKNMLEEALKFPVEGIMATILGMKNRKDQTLTLKNFSKDKYMICGIKDPIISIEDSKILALRTETKIKIVDGGHLGLIENFDEIVKFFLLSLI